MPTMDVDETALLGVVPMDYHDDVEMKNVELQIPSSRSFHNSWTCQEVRVRTDRGDILVAVQGNRFKPAIITYHDLGLNYLSFLPFFNFVSMRKVLENFCIYHVNAPGQEDDAADLPENFEYPTMDELANMLNYVLGYFSISSFIGFGVGAGANILARFAICLPHKVEALALINCTSQRVGWIEWVYGKLNTHALRNRGMTPGVIDYLLWHHFGKSEEVRNKDLMANYRNFFTRALNPYNLSLFMKSYARRDDLPISRDSYTILPPVLNITGAYSPHVEDTITLNGKLNPNNSTWMKISDCGMVLDEQPAKLSQAFRLFLQGEGHVAPLSPVKLVSYGRLSDTSRRKQCRLSPVIRITENPISEAVVC